jgi:hypothetical protein
MATKWEEKFPEYDAKHPDIWEQFKKFTFEIVAAGNQHTSACLVLFRIRYESVIRRFADEDYKVSSQYAAYYARKFEREFPQHVGLFTKRKLRE